LFFFKLCMTIYDRQKIVGDKKGDINQ